MDAKVFELIWKGPLDITADHLLETVRLWVWVAGIHGSPAELTAQQASNEESDHDRIHSLNEGVLDPAAYAYLSFTPLITIADRTTTRYKVQLWYVRRDESFKIRAVETILALIKDEFDAI